MRPRYAIYVEEQLIDLDPKTIIAITLQASDFASGDIITRKASFTNQLKVPSSPTNIRIFEFANNPKSGSTLPYTKKMIKILANGIQILEGVTIIKSFDTYFNLQIYSIPKDLSFRIANLYLSDLDFGDSPITWNAAFIDSKRASTTGWCAPVINYGQINTALIPNPDIGTYYLPAISYKDTLTAILNNAGYTVSGTFYTSDAVFNKLVLTYARQDFLSTTLKMNEALSTTFLQSDFIKDFFIRFGAFFRYSNNNIEIITYESILSNTSNAIDWTNKRVKNKKDVIQYTWGSLAQINNFLYNSPSNGESTFDVNVYKPWFNPNGSLTINNENISASTDLYTSIFERPEFVTQNSNIPVDTAIEFAGGGGVGSYYCVTSSIWDKAMPSSYTFDNPPKPMLALLCPKDASEAACNYNGTNRTDYLVGRFSSIDITGTVLASATQSLGWQQLQPVSGTINGLLDIYYNQVQLLFDRGLITTTHEYNLTDLDINNLDLLTPIFDDGNYYLINKVNSFVSYKTTRVELLKI